MKRILSYCLIFFSFCAVYAQTADVEVSYNHRSFYKNGKERNANYHLLANPTYSKFFSPKSEEIDSISSTPEGLANYKKVQEKALLSMLEKGYIDMNKMPRKTEQDYVVKSQKDSLISYYDMVLDEAFYYTEPYSDLSWTIGDDTKTILGYECIKAEADYHGIHWTAWFTPDIPIHDGPWKMRGLPGMILEATYGSNGAGYYADGIVNSKKEIKPIYGVEKYEKTTRKRLEDTKKKLRENGENMLKSKGMYQGVKIDK